MADADTVHDLRVQVAHAQSIVSTWGLKPNPLTWSSPDHGELFHWFQWALNQDNLTRWRKEVN